MRRTLSVGRKVVLNKPRARRWHTPRRLSSPRDWIWRYSGWSPLGGHVLALPPPLRGVAG